MSDTDIPEPDCAEYAPHPRFAKTVIGQDAAAQVFLDAFNAERVHHAWLLSGPAGIGKATLAWQIARVLLSNRPHEEPGLFGAPVVPSLTGLRTDHETDVGRRVSALSDPGLHLVRRPWDAKRKAISAQITVDVVRALKHQLSMSLPDGGRRVVIIDSANDMNSSAANALLKLLEEPPAHTVFLLVSAMPTALLPTIRSRCLSLACAPLAPENVSRVLRTLLPDLEADAERELAALSGGSPGAALRLHTHDGASLQASLVRLMATMPGMDRTRALELATSLSARGSEDKRELFLDLTHSTIAQLARQGVSGASNEEATSKEHAELLTRLSPNPRAGRLWASAQSDLTGRVRQGLAVNLDPYSLILDMVLKIDSLARDCVAE